MTATISASPASAVPLQTANVTGSGFAASSALMVTFGLIPVDFSEATSDGSGGISGSFTIPRLPLNVFGDTGAIYDVTVTDASGNTATAEITLCGKASGDGIDATVNPKLSTDLAPGGGGAQAYLHALGSHWTVWQEAFELTPNATNLGWPVPSNAATMKVSMVSDDGAVEVEYDLVTNPRYIYAVPPNALGNINQQTDPLSTCSDKVVADIWTRTWWFDDWDKPVMDVKMATDGTTVWIAILTRETVNYPWMQGSFDGPNALDVAGSPGITRLTGYSPHQRLSIGLLDFCHRTAFPCDDFGDACTGTWDPPVVVVFAGDTGGFNLIGRMEAKYCPGAHATGTRSDVCFSANQGGVRGSFYSGISMAASDAAPGVCHLVWSEGGQWGPCGLATEDENGCNEPLVWDGGPQNLDYRVGYSTWSSGAKIAEYDLWHTHQDRTNWTFDY